MYNGKGQTSQNNESKCVENNTQRSCVQGEEFICLWNILLHQGNWIVKCLHSIFQNYAHSNLFISYLSFLGQRLIFEVTFLPFISFFFYIRSVQAKKSCLLSSFFCCCFHSKADVMMFSGGNR